MNPHPQDRSAEKLRDSIRSLLGGSLGGNPFRPDHTNSWKPLPVIAGLQVGIVYALVFCALPWIILSISGLKKLDLLLWLSIWGSFYVAFGTAISRSTCYAIVETIEDRILQGLSQSAADAIVKDLDDRFQRKRLLATSLLAALLAAVWSAFTIYQDTRCKTPPHWEIAWCCCGLFVVYFVSTRTALVARFYSTFAAHLKIDSDRVYALDPAHSLQVAGIASVGRRVQLFWFGILCSVVVPLCLVYRLQRYELVPWGHFSWFLWSFIIPAACLFPLGYGTLVFLSSERNLRDVINKVAASTLHSLEHDIAGLLKDRRNLDEQQWKRLRDLMALHDQLAATGPYRSVVISGLSILIPLLPVATAAILKAVLE